MLELAPCSAEQYADELARVPGATLFHTPPWLAVLARSFGVRFRHYLAACGGEIVGALPLGLLRKGLFRVAASPLPGWCTPYLGPAAGGAHLAEALAAAVREARRIGVDHLELTIPQLIDPAPLRRTGAVVEPRRTFLIPLTESAEAIWKHRVGGKCRNMVRKARKSGVTVREVRLSEFVDRYFEMSVAVYRRQAVPPPLPRRFFRAAAEALEPAGMLLTLVAEHEGRPIAAALFPHWRGRIHYLDNVTDSAFYKLAPNNLIQWELIERAAAMGLAVYDMVGANVPSIAAFKASFGPDVHEYCRLYCGFHPLARLLRGLGERPWLRKPLWRLAAKLNR